MSKICVAVMFGGGHYFEPGSPAELRRLKANLYEVCEKPKNHHDHHCGNGCERLARESADGYCCKRCQTDRGHSTKCDKRAGD